MIEKEVLVAEIKGLLMALEKESAYVRYNLGFDNVYNVKSLDKMRAYLDAITAKMTHEEIETDDNEWI